MIPNGCGGSPPSQSLLLQQHPDSTWSSWTLILRCFWPSEHPTPSPPEDIVCAEAWVSPTNSHAKLLSHCHHPPPPPTLSPTFTEVAELIANLPADLKWAITHVSLPDNGASLAQAIIEGKAVSVSDASCKDLFGTAALVVEGPPTHHSATAVNITPGPIKDGDSTCCETGGLIGIVVLTMAICTFHQVTTGSIVIACDNTTSIRIFQPDFVPDPNEESFDLVPASTAWHNNLLSH